MQVPVAGEKDRSKWVLFVSQNASMQYFVGNFDGARFINENPQDRICRPDEGPDYYAAVTYHLGQDKSPVSIGWVNNWNYANDVPTFSWRGAMSLPRKLSLKKINDHWVLRQEPIPALRSLRGAPLLHRRQLVVDSEKILDAQSTQCELSVSWKPHPGCVSGLELAAGATKPVMVGYDAKTGRLFIERTGAGDTTFNRAYGMLSTFSAWSGCTSFLITASWRYLQAMENS
jgi:fructan beta-fructosidase